MYLGINSGSIIGHLVTPLLFPIDCFGEDNCFALPFGLMAFMMIVALAILITGYFTRNYKRDKPKRNVILDTFGVLGHAVWYKIKSLGGQEKPEESPEKERRKPFNDFLNNETASPSSTHKQKKRLLDYAVPKYGEEFVSDVRAFLKVSIIFIPPIFFWMCFNQQYTLWRWQATNLDGNLFGDKSYGAIPAQYANILNSVFVVVFIALFQKVIYPGLAKYGLLKKSLHRVIAGMVLTVVAFLISGGLEYEMEKHYPKLPGEGQMRFSVHNGIDPSTGCQFGNFSLRSEKDNRSIQLDLSKKHFLTDFVTQGDFAIVGQTVQCNGNQELQFKNTTWTKVFDKDSKEAQDVLFTLNSNNQGQVFIGTNPVKLDIPRLVRPTRKFVWNVDADYEVCIQRGEETYEDCTRNQQKTNLTKGMGDSMPETSDEIFQFVGPYDIVVYDKSRQEISRNSFTAREGANYEFLIQIQKGSIKLVPFNEVRTTEPNRYSLAWLIPQYLVITMAEILVSITLLAFAFSQAPQSMRIMLAAVNLLSVSFGDLIGGAIFTGKVLKKFAYRANVHWLMAGLTSLATVFMVILERRYKYQDFTQSTDENDDSVDQSSGRSERPSKLDPKSEDQRATLNENR